MSHFTVGVICEDPAELGRILEPFNECTEDAKYREFNSLETEYREKWEKESSRMVVMEDGTFKYPYDREFFVEVSKVQYDAYHNEKPDEYRTSWERGGEKYYRMEYGNRVVKEIPFKEQFPEFSDFMEDMGYSRDEEKGEYGYWYNPMAKWDWWQIGGRWTGMIKAKEGIVGEPSLVCPRTVESGYYDIAKLKDIDFSRDEKAYAQAIRFWEVYVEEGELKEGETKEMFDSFYKREYYLNRYGDKERYARERSEFNTFAVVTPDGKWHEQGSMGWFGVSSETHEEARDWHDSWYDNFIKDADKELWLCIIDCHI